MAATSGSADRSVTNQRVATEAAQAAARTERNAWVDWVADNPRRFTFFQAVRILERRLEGQPLGRAGLPRNERLRIRAHASLGFPAWDVEEILSQDDPWRPGTERFIVTATFLGLYGPASPLPTNYTDMLIRQQDAEDEEDRERARAFVDIFHHRIFSLFYRILSKYRYHLLYERTGDDAFSGYMLSLIGRGTRGMRGKRPIEAIHWLRYAGLLNQNPRSAAGLEGLLRDYLNVPLGIEQCSGRWLPVEDRNVMGKKFCALGEDLIVGAAVYDRTGKFRVSVGPVGFAEFKRYLPSGVLMERLKELVRLYLVDPIDFDLEVWLRGDEVPMMEMSSTAENPPMLGWTSWALTSPGPDRAVVFRCAD